MTGGRSASVRGAHAVEVAAQAKINLRLRILARETSGYHQLETLFLRIDLTDTVRIRRTSGERSLDVIGEIDPALIGPVEKNLAYRAAESYFAASGMPGGFAIELTKRIPIGGGLGGGSADAGAVLRALDTMQDRSVGPELLLSLAANLGADVPFLATEHAYALAWGRGERMLALPAPPPRDAILVVPGYSINTAEAFGWLSDPQAWRAKQRYTESFALDPNSLSDWEALPKLVGNDFEGAVESHHPEMREQYQFLLECLCPLTVMTGSGSTLFGIWTSSSSGPALESIPSDPPAGARYILTRTSARVEQVSVIE